MSYRFIVGVVLSALITNFAVAAEIERSHVVMQRQPVWQYMDANVPLRWWALAFALVGIGKIIAVTFERDKLARWFCFLSFDMLALMLALTLLAYFQGLGPKFSLMVPILALSALTSEGLYLVLSSYDPLDRVRARRRTQLTKSFLTAD